ncbi:MAG: glycosyl transferase family protein [Bradyrhizobium sp.]|nr:MAG: glycosyl transferase family protein [Bradyrhizobium sp.]
MGVTVEPHPFARFIAILGRGKSLTRALTLAEAEAAMAMILAGDARPEQIGAFLMLLRVKEETGEEIAGFARAVRATLPPLAIEVDLDWPSYAGKGRRPPYFLLAALALADAGWRVAMHGHEGHTAGRLYTREALGRLGLPVATGFDDAATQLKARNFTFLPLETFSPALAELFALRSILGLRSPVHTLARLLNPFGAPASLQSVFHPGYMTIHRDAALRLGQKRMTVLRGEGGEAERRPSKPCDTLTIEDGAPGEMRWPPLLADPRPVAEGEPLDLDRLAALWRGETEDESALAAILGTIALALTTLGVERDPAGAMARAGGLWRARDRRRLAAAA